MLLRPPFALALMLVVGLLSSGCSNRRIPGTDIEDTDETRAILAVMENFRAAIEAEDTNAVAVLLAPGFKDDGGTLDRADDYDIGNVRTKLQANFDHVKNIRLSVDVKGITLDKPKTHATVTHYWTLRFELSTPGSRPQTDSELKQTVLELVDDEWKIVSGI